MRTTVVNKKSSFAPSGTADVCIGATEPVLEKVKSNPGLFVCMVVET